ncbi:MAG: tannase/feruloyl esterase family alpha/beta hydrolase [Acidobacteria bacterium]|nr:tannase/feruloyl esterase family alpha/beta hydrolase [Acidobacteriota bacterium]
MRLWWLMLPAALFGQGAGQVQFRDLGPMRPDRRPAISCRELLSLTGFEFSVVSARVVAGTSDAPEHCRVRLFTQPELNIEVNLPTDWNGRLYMFGNGGWAGEAFDTSGRATNRARGLKAGFATASTDTGHSAAAEPGASFALNRQKLLDYGFRSLHLTAEAAKTMARAYYGMAPAKSYYEGCSQGGRQGLTLAQRFPNDFDGIVAGAPALNQTGTHLSRAYWMRAMNENPFPASKLPLLAERVYAFCDAKDGLKDGLIDDPRRCGFKASRDLPRCVAGSDRPDCFTSNEIASLERIYSDVVSKGERFFPGWPVGAEVIGPNGKSGWLGQEVVDADGRSAWAFYGHNFLEFVVPATRTRPDAADAKRLFSRVDVANDPPDVEDAHDIIDANDPNLSAFRKHGGKLLLYYGWADPQLNPMMGVEYYEQVVRAMGPTTGDFARLFMVPGMFHCGGGVGTSVFDAASPVVQWVEGGKSPNRIEAARVVDGKVLRTRPLCPYPQAARYKGAGSIDDAANFTCANP